MNLSRLTFLLALAACRTQVEPALDLDHDGYTDDVDCDDTDASVHPDADESCDGLDNDCDAAIDEDPVDADTYFADVDGDGYGDGAHTVQACALPSGYVTRDGDCDDTKPAFHPGAAEVDCADPNDYNCDGSVGFTDADADGFAACEECDDSSAARFPGNTEICDDLDNDCDNLVDNDPTDAQTFYADLDGDGHGDHTSPTTACEAPEGWVIAADDCDDLNANAFPGNDEVCDGEDNNCDGDTDGDAIDVRAWYRDADGDHYGDYQTDTTACEAPEGYVADGTDCDDAHPSAHPGGTEVCDALDNDCDGSADEGAVDARTWYADADGDGHGDPATGQTTCTPAEGAILDRSDCDDSSAERFPGNTEVCDGLDNDCDGTPDDNPVDASTWYTDEDGDGYGLDSGALRRCAQPAGTAPRGGDCDDSSAARFPGNAELCDGLDNDCDGTPDDNATDAGIWFTDGDHDGWGLDGSFTRACAQPPDTATRSGDCDDGSAARFPGNPEICDSLDNDCDGTVDDNPSGAPTWYRDLDHDGYAGDLVTFTACAIPAGLDWHAIAEDCDDVDRAVHPAASEHCNGYDDDCDGAVDEDSATDAPLWHVDSDLDGFGQADSYAPACVVRAGLSADGTDCDDTAADVFPGAPTVCDDVDHDCDGGIDFDVDGDGWSDLACGGSDCDDADPSTYPAAPQACDDVDHDCDEVVDFDVDGDGWSDLACGGSDCDDAASDTFPGAPEVCDDVDHNCDGAIDFDADGDGQADQGCGGSDCDDGAADTYLGAPQACDDDDHDCDGAIDFDADGDGWADEACGGSDCDDADGGFSPDAAEVCDGLDNDCDGLRDNDLLGSESVCAGDSCLEIHASSPSAPSGSYWIDPAHATPFQAWCDMSSDGGGYSLLKVDYGSAVGAATAESDCATRGMQLFIPRSQAHLRAAYAVSYNAAIGPSAGNYLYIMGVYPNYNGATCTTKALRTGSSGCNWRAGDGHAFWVSNLTTITEPNGDNCTTCSMYYAFNSSGDVTWYNDVSAGYTSRYYICQVGDKY
ncbi:MAG: putative metal-binding motif-containing protein [Deltaproteobacteria bacterium]|nr:putative metal-binding motif-containing protein [Deltaproteobacteria bacterium]